jgi:hypothetical protein
LQQLVLTIQQILGQHVVSRQTDLAVTAPIAERTAAGPFEPFARQIIDTQIHRVTREQGEHHTTMEQADTAEHAPRRRFERTEQIHDEVLEAAADAGRLRPAAIYGFQLFTFRCILPLS